MRMGERDLKKYARINQFLVKNSGVTLDALKEDIRNELRSCGEGYYVLAEIYRDGKVYIHRKKEGGEFDADESGFNWEWHWGMSSKWNDADYDLIFDLEFCGEVYDNYDLIFDLEFCGEVYDWLEENGIE